MKEMIRCGECVHYKDVEEGVQSYGECRRYPPTACNFIIKRFFGMFTKTEVFANDFPLVDPDEYCGEFRQK